MDKMPLSFLDRGYALSLSLPHLRAIGSGSQVFHAEKTQMVKTIIPYFEDRP
jgi:hypothetical protein